MRLRRRMARFNRVGPNRVMGLWAPYLPPFALVLHHGRSSGTAYKTVVLAWRRGDTLVIGLFYGETDWLRNVLATGGQVTRRGHTFVLEDPHVVTSPADLPPGTRWTARLAGTALVARLTPAP